MQTQVKAAILAETNIMIEGIVNRQNIILRDLRIRSEEDKLTYIKSLIDKEFTRRKTYRSKATGYN